LKRLFDLFAALAGLLILLPVFIVVGILVVIKLGSPVFFRQIRPGKNEVPFHLIKFRTMSNARDENGALLPNEQRMSKFGKFLRSTSLDELPELVNVIKGEMSIVGPRPLLMDYLPLYNDFQKQRHQVKPGITGWAQINGRNALSWDDKFELDIWYIRHRSFGLDLKIVLLTIVKVFKREGISHKDNVAMPRFTGNQPPPST